LKRVLSKARTTARSRSKPEKVWITAPRTTFESIVDESLTRAAVDPSSKLIDRNREDNWADLDHRLKLPASLSGGVIQAEEVCAARMGSCADTFSC
jgi:hypothetical protein